MNPLRIATQEEVDIFAAQSDLIPGTLLLALDTDDGTLFAAVRTVVEVDPLISPEGTALRKKINFMRDVETFLMAKGVSQYYFNVDAQDEPWLDVIEGWGAEPTNGIPEIRYKKEL